MTHPYKPTEKWDVHTHTTLSPDTFGALARFSHYEKFLRVAAHPDKPCCAKMVNSKGELFRDIEHNAYDGAARIDECDQHGVTVQVLSPTPGMIPDYVDRADDAAEICRILNDDNARLVNAFPDRFVAIGALPMLHPDEAVREMERIKKLGMNGVEINSNIGGMDLDDPRLYPIFEAAATMGMAVFIHPWGGFMEPEKVRGELIKRLEGDEKFKEIKDELLSLFSQTEKLQKRMNPNRNWRPWLTAMPLETALAFDAMARGGVHERLPNLRVLYAHGGGAFPALLGRLEHGSYCRPDLFRDASQKDVWQTVKDCGVYTDTLTHNPWALKMLADMLGSSRVAMGSDYPYPLGEVDPFDAHSKEDPKGNACPYPQTKGIYPGHMIEHLPSCPEEQDAAWKHFNWLARDNADGPRDLPVLSVQQKENMLHLTAKKWLGLG